MEVILTKHPRSGPSTLKANFDHRLTLYGVAAAAATVSLLALAQPADAEVVITKKTIPIPLCPVGACPVSVDLNKDGVADFSFTLGSFGYREGNFGRVHVRPLAGGEAVGTPNRGYFGAYASALLQGAKIGLSAQFASSTRSGGVTLEGSEQCATYCNGQYSRKFYGNWGGNHPNRFLGVKFQIKGQTHYGWVRITVTTSAGKKMSAEITEYGYETIANRRVLAGEASKNAEVPAAESASPASLGALALGADGLASWRSVN